MNWRHLSEAHPTAKREHSCFCCGLAIAAGEKYRKRAGVGGDGFLAMRMHERCAAITDNEYRSDEDWECHDVAEFRERLSRRAAP